MTNITTIKFCGRLAQSAALYQYDYGQQLVFQNIELPPTYEVHFANDGDAETITMLGDVDGVLVPDELLLTGKNIKAYIYLHAGEDDGETEYCATIPVAVRPEPSDVEPTPVQQNIIEQAIAKLTEAVEDYENITTATEEDEGKALTVKTVEDGKVTEWEFKTGGGGGQPGPPGFSPIANVTKSGNTATITITDKNGTTTAQVSDGQDGQDGDDGYSPTATVTKSGSTATISITDKNGTTTAQVSDGTDGQDGDDGITPTATVTTITGGHNVAFSYGSGDARNTDFDVMDGQDGTDGHSPVVTASKTGKVTTVSVDGTPIATINDGEDGAAADASDILPTDVSTGYIPDGYPFDVRDLKVNIAPKQSGTGDPSPENIRTITGWDSVTVTRTGKNLFNKSVMSNALTSLKTVELKLAPNTTYTMSTTLPRVNDAAHSFFYLPGGSPSTNNNGVWNNRPRTLTTGSDGVAMVSYRLSTFTTQEYLAFDYQIEAGSTATAYEPYQGQTYPIPLGRTVYGGTLDVTTGELIVDKGYIASYNGETLPSTWMSDRDVYSEGATPTTGAQVLYELAEPQKYALIPQQVALLKGINNVFANAGTVEVMYSADIQLYIEATINDGEDGASGEATVETVSGTNPVITGVANTRYICGEVSTISITPPQSGIIDVIFTSGSSVALLTVPSTVKWPSGFDPTSLETNTTYELNIMDGVYGAVMSWT